MRNVFSISSWARVVLWTLSAGVLPPAAGPNRKFGNELPLKRLPPKKWSSPISSYGRRDLSMCIAPSSIGSLDKSESDVNNSPDFVSDKMNAHQNIPEKTASPTAFLFWMLALLVSTSCQRDRKSVV